MRTPQRGFHSMTAAFNSRVHNHKTTVACGCFTLPWQDACELAAQCTRSCKRTSPSSSSPLTENPPHPPALSLALLYCTIDGDNVAPSGVIYMNSSGTEDRSSLPAYPESV
ncbi:hypothetical protein MRX96_003544 [Rhipicephalus microplus]